MKRRVLNALRTIGIALGFAKPLTPQIDAGISIDYAHEGQPVRVLALDAASPSGLIFGPVAYMPITNVPVGSVLRAFTAAERLTRGDLVEISRDGRARRVRSRLNAWRGDWPIYPIEPADDRMPRVTVRRTDDASGVTWTEDYR